MTDRGTGFAESEAILAAQAEDWDRVRSLLRDLSDRELRELRNAALNLESEVYEEIESRRS